MPALSPTMEQGKLAKWLVKKGDQVQSGDILAEIETDKATMEFEAVEEGTIAAISVAEGAEDVKVGTVIALLAEEGEDADAIAADGAAGSQPTSGAASEESESPKSTPSPAAPSSSPAPKSAPAHSKKERIIATPSARHHSEEKGVDLAGVTGTGPNGRIVQADVLSAKVGAGEPAGAAGSAAISPLARRLAEAKGVDVASVTGTGPNGRIVRADIEASEPGTATSSPPAPSKAPPTAADPAPAADMSKETRALLDARVPHTVQKLSGMRKTIAKRLAQSMQEAPHIYLTVDIRLDKLMAMRKDVNAALEKQGIKVSVNDFLIKALGKALTDVPECNVTFAGNEMIQYSRADISVAVSIPGGLITPIVQDASGKSLSEIAAASKDLATRAKEGKLKPDEFQGGTASISNMGMMGIKQFTAVINPPQSTILAIGAGEKRPWVMEDGQLGVATVMSATGSFDHRAVDGADGARLMAAFKDYVENPLGMVV